VVVVEVEGVKEGDFFGSVNEVEGYVLVSGTEAVAVLFAVVGRSLFERLRNLKAFFHLCFPLLLSFFSSFLTGAPSTLPPLLFSIIVVTILK
jgi:hypothetical protein